MEASDSSKDSLLDMWPVIQQLIDPSHLFDAFNPLNPFNMLADDEMDEIDAIVAAETRSYVIHNPEHYRREPMQRRFADVMEPTWKPKPDDPDLAQPEQQRW
jgi:hypothetical protein